MPQRRPRSERRTKERDNRGIRLPTAKPLTEEELAKPKIIKGKIKATSRTSNAPRVQVVPEASPAATLLSQAVDLTPATRVLPPDAKLANGRLASIECLDSLMADPANIQKLANHMQEIFDLNPTSFFKEFVIPLTPKESLIKLSGDERNKAPVRIIFNDGEDETQPADVQAAPAVKAILPSSGSNT